MLLNEKLKFNFFELKLICHDFKSKKTLNYSKYPFLIFIEQ